MIQLTGLSGAGKSTIATAACQLLQQNGLPATVVDGDECRKTICKDLGFSREDRHENIRRLGLLADKFVKAGQITIIAAINPYEEIRAELAEHYQAKTVWVNCSRDELLVRDTKGLYKRALLPDGHPDKVNNLTGVNDTYDIPESPDLVIQTDIETAESSANRLYAFILQLVKP